ncbi:MAG: acyltransferase family protein [Bacteroidaceae bacterium]|nr:acyltransferase family protein [Bacteroidaceae bacterium]
MITITEKKQIVWLDAVRLVAFFSLAMCHAADPFNAAATYGTGEIVGADAQLWGQLWGCFVRPCVPLFVMLTGALLLPVSQPMGGFYRKRIGRVLWPFLIWSVLYNLFPWFLKLSGVDENIFYIFYPWAESDAQTLNACLKAIASIPYTFSSITTHMWYIYMLIGLYLYMPILSAWVERASRRQIEFFLLLWGASTLLPYVQQYVSPFIFGTCDWNAFGTFYYFAGFTGYLLLGYYLRHYVTLSFSKTLPLSIILFAIGYAVTFAGFHSILALPELTPSLVELFWTYNSLNVVLMTTAWFLLIKHVKLSAESRTTRLLHSLTLCGFGIYMIHYFFVGPCFLLVTSLNIPVALMIPVSALFILVISWIIVAVTKPILGRAGKIIFG